MNAGKKMYGVYTVNAGKYYRSLIHANLSSCLRLTDELTAKGSNCIIVLDEVQNLHSSFEALPKTIMEFKGINGY
jgi:hypothetical protein